jgi:RNA polymerase sigma-70 factor (ECF subfamily)
VAVRRRTVLRELAEPDREVLLTAAWYDLSPAEAAAVLGCTRGTYAVRLHRARRRFERAFRSAGRPVPSTSDVTALMA